MPEVRVAQGAADRGAQAAEPAPGVRLRASPATLLKVVTNGSAAEEEYRSAGEVSSPIVRLHDQL